MKRPLALMAGASLLLLLLVVGIVSAATQRPKISPPRFDASNFHHPTRIDNPYFPLSPGTVFTYNGVEGGEDQQDVVTVTHDTKVIDGVECVVVNDTASLMNGAPLEVTTDWYAQDDTGNVWYMGEDTTAYKNGLVSTAGSWQAGVDGAQPGYIMEARAQVGDVYRQEYLPGEAEDMAKVLSLTASVSVPYGSWSGNVVQTQETTALEPGVLEQKYYARGVGEVKAELVRGGSEVSELVSVTGGH